MKPTIPLHTVIVQMRLAAQGVGTYDAQIVHQYYELSFQLAKQTPGFLRPVRSLPVPEVVLHNQTFSRRRCRIFGIVLFMAIVVSGTNAQQWNHLGPGLNNAGTTSIALADTSVYVGGYFRDAGGNPDADFIARWDGCQWNAVGGGVNGVVLCIAISGADIYIGGEFTQPFPYLARWDGSQWNAVGDLPEGPVWDILLEGEDVMIGGGEYVGAVFGFVSQLNGSSWTNLGSFNRLVSNLNMDGTFLYASGPFRNAGGNQDADGIARWDGSTWSNLGSPVSNGTYIYDMVIHDDELFAVGSFWNLCGNPEADNVAKWDGTEWIGLEFAAEVQSITAFQGSIYISTFGTGIALPIGIYQWDINSSEWVLFEKIPDMEELSLRPMVSDNDNLFIGVDDYMVMDNKPYLGIARWGPASDSIDFPQILDTLCESSPLYSLPTSINGYTGNWSGLGVSNNIFNSSGLCGNITITFNSDPGQCASHEQTKIKVVNLGETFDDIYSTCDDNHTPADTTDDIIVLHINGQGCHAGNSYHLEVSTSDITPNIGTYGIWNEFYLAPGSAGGGNFILTLKDSSVQHCEFQVEIQDPGPCLMVGLNDEVDELFKSIQVFPNPTNHSIYIAGRQDINKDCSAVVIDTNGELMQAYPVIPNEINMHEWPSGMYYLKMQCGEKEDVRKITRL